MNKAKWWGLIAAIVLFSVAKAVRADGLALTSIGVLSTIGIDYSNVNYTGGIPTFQGTASPGAQVAVKIKTTVGYATTASPSGIWQFVPTSLDTGSNAVSITSGSDLLSFTLNFNTVTPTATPTAVMVPKELPQTGEWEYYLPAVGGGLLVLFLGGYVKNKMHKWEGRVK